MNFETLREPAAAGEPVSRTQASSLDIGGQRTRDLQERRKHRVAVDVDRGFPGTSQHHLHSIEAERTGLIEIPSMALSAWTSMRQPEPYQSTRARSIFLLKPGMVHDER